MSEQQQHPHQAPTEVSATGEFAHRPTGWALPFALALGVAAFVALAVFAFAAPAVGAVPHDVPIGVVAPANAASGLTAALEAKAPGTFAVRTYPDDEALRAAIRVREVYGGLVVGASGRSVYTASAASPVVAQALSALAAGLAASGAGPAPTVLDIVALPASDPRGAGLPASLLPMLFGAVLPVVALGRVTRRRGVQLVGVCLAAVASGFAATAVLQGLGAISGAYAATALALTAAIGAGSLGLLGLHSVAGLPGLGLGVLVLLLLGNPLSAAATAPELLAQPWRGIGQWLVPGAGAQVVRSAAFFDGAGAGGAWLVLAVWTLVGVALIALPRRVRAVPATG